MEGRLELELFAPEDREYHMWIKEQELSLIVTVTLRGSTVEKWIEKVKKDILDAAPIKCVGLDCEFTHPREPNQRAAVLQLSVAKKTLVFHIMWATYVPQMLKDFLQDKTIRFRGAAIHNDVSMLSTYKIVILSAYDLQKIIPNPTNKTTPSLFDLANATLAFGNKDETNPLGGEKNMTEPIVNKKKTNNKKNKKENKKEQMTKEEEELIFGWGNVPLSGEKVEYAALDAHLGFEIARRH